VSYSTRREAEGQKIDKLADGNQLDVEATIKATQEARRREPRPVQLQRRDSTRSKGADSTPVPAIGVRPPALPALPLPNSQQDRNTAPVQPQTSQPS